MNELLKIIVAIIIVIVVNPAVKWIVNKARNEKDLIIPDGIKTEIWRAVVKRPSGGGWIGSIERLIFLACFWYGTYAIPIIGVWFAFKVATKWEVWKNIIQVPKSLGSEFDLSYLKARHDWGAYIYARFLVGTGANLLVSVFATYAGKNIDYFIC